MSLYAACIIAVHFDDGSMAPWAVPQCNQKEHPRIVCATSIIAPQSRKGYAVCIDPDKKTIVYDGPIYPTKET